jgi:HEAT repeat protein
MDDPDAIVRIESIRALTKIIDSPIQERVKRTIFDPLVKTLGDPNNNVRSTGVLALGTLTKSKNIPARWKNDLVKPLINLLGDNDGGVRRDALWVLNDLLSAEISQEKKNEIIRVKGGR